MLARAGRQAGPQDRAGLAMRQPRGSKGWRSSLWQREFFDHLLRSNESYKAKWAYVRMNPVRAALVERPEDWPYQGYVDYD